MPSSPIHHAAAMGRLAQVQALLADDPSLLNAVHRGREDAAGDPSDWAGSTPLVLAARYNQAHVAAVLLRLPGVVLDARDTRGMGFLHWSAKRHYHSVLALALGHGNDERDGGDEAKAEGAAGVAVDADGAATAAAFPFPGGAVYQPPVPAVLEGSRRLLASKDRVGYTPLMHCVDMSGPVVWEGLEPTLRVLMRRVHLPYLEVHAQSAYRGDTAMHLVLAGRWPRMHALRLLLEFTGGDPRKRNFAGKSPLALALEKGEAYLPAVAVLQAAVDETERTGFLARVRSLLHATANNIQNVTPAPASTSMMPMHCFSSSSTSTRGTRSVAGYARDAATSTSTSSSSRRVHPRMMASVDPRLPRLRQPNRRDYFKEADSDDDEWEEEAAAAVAALPPPVAVGLYTLQPPPQMKQEQEAERNPDPPSRRSGRRRRRASVGSDGSDGEEHTKDEGGDGGKLRAVAAFAVGGSVPTEGTEASGSSTTNNDVSASAARECYLPPELFNELMDYLAPPWDPLRERATYPPTTAPSTPARRMLVRRAAASSSGCGSGSSSSVGWFTERAGGCGVVASSSAVARGQRREQQGGGGSVEKEG